VDDVDALIRSGLQRHVLYCPSGAEQDSDELWKTYYQNYGYGVIGFILLTPHGDPWSSTRLFGRDIQVKLTKVTGTNTHNLTDTELAVDAVISSGRPPSFTYARAGATHRTSHLDRNQPAGGNVLYLDGHVAWRKYQDMKVRHDAGWDTIRFYF
jgi:prepilin-type processing-associated H-X9-DG protein